MHTGISEENRTENPTVSHLYLAINAFSYLTKHLCLPLSLFNPFLFFLPLFTVLPSHLHSALPHLPPPSQLPHPSSYPSIHPIRWYSQWNTWSIYKIIKAHSFQHTATREKEGEMESEVKGEVGSWRYGGRKIQGT